MIFTKQDRLALADVSASIAGLRVWLVERILKVESENLIVTEQNRQRGETIDRRWKMLNERLDCQLLLNDFLIGALKKSDETAQMYSALENRLVEHHNAYAVLLQNALSAIATGGEVIAAQAIVEKVTRRVKRKKGKR
jgi:hypothetical protein